MIKIPKYIITQIANSRYSGQMYVCGGIKNRVYVALSSDKYGPGCPDVNGIYARNFLRLILRLAKVGFEPQGVIVANNSHSERFYGAFVHSFLHSYPRLFYGVVGEDCKGGCVVWCKEKGKTKRRSGKEVIVNGEKDQGDHSTSTKGHDNSHC